MTDARTLADADLHVLSHATGGAVVLVDAEGRVRMRSRRAAQCLGARTTSTAAPDFAARWAPVHERIRKALKARGAGPEIELDLPANGDDAPPLALRVVTLPVREGGGYVALFTERRALDALQSDLRHAAQMRHLHARHRQAAHDLRAPLNAIALNLELIRQDIADSPARGALERIEMLRREVTRLSRMLQVLLAQSGPPRMRPRVFGLRRLLREVLELIEPQASRFGVNLELSLPKHRLAVLAPRDLLKQALLNLVMNALEAMPQGGRAQLQLSDADGRTFIDVRDEGVGIPSAQLEHVFRMHYTTKPGGSGIGLFTSRAAIESMGGALTIESRQGAGTTARIELPVAAGDTASEVSCFTY